MGTTSGNKTLVTETSAADIKTSVQVMDDWDDGADNCKININAQTLTAVKVSKDANANATGNRIFVTNNTDQLNGNTIEVTSGNLTNGVQRVCIATNDVNMSIVVAAIGTDGSAAPTRPIQTGVDDGTNIRNTKGGADGAVYVNQNNLLPGEDAVNDERAIKVKTLGTGNGSALAQPINTVGGGTIGDPILTSTEVLGYSRICLEFKNAAGGGGNDIDRLILFGSVSGSNWDPIYDSGAGLAWSAADGGLTVLIESNGYRYIKTEGLTAAGDTTVDCYWCGNKG